MKLGVAVAIQLAFVALWSFCGWTACEWTGLSRPASAPDARQLGYEVVYRAARGVRAGYDLCARRAVDRVDLALARRCDATYEAARVGLLAAEATLDAWSEARVGELGCAARRVADGMAGLSDALASAGVRAPVGLTDGIRVATRLAATAGTCGAPATPTAATDGGVDG